MLQKGQWGRGPGLGSGPFPEKTRNFAFLWNSGAFSAKCNLQASSFTYLFPPNPHSTPWGRCYHYFHIPTDIELPRPHKKMAKSGLEPSSVWLEKGAWTRSDINGSLCPEFKKARLEMDGKCDHIQNSLKSRKKRGSPLASRWHMTPSKAPEWNHQPQWLRQEKPSSSRGRVHGEKGYLGDGCESRLHSLSGCVPCLGKSLTHPESPVLSCKRGVTNRPNYKPAPWSFGKLA